MTKSEGYYEYRGHARSHSSKPLLHAFRTPSASPERSLGNPAACTGTPGLPRRTHRLAIYALTGLLVIAGYAAWLTHGAFSGLHTLSTFAGSTSRTNISGNGIGGPAGYDYDDMPQQEDEHSLSLNTEEIIPVEAEKQRYSPWVLGPPTQSFRDNLRPHTKYITSWLDAGWSTYHLTCLIASACCTCRFEATSSILIHLTAR